MKKGNILKLIVPLVFLPLWLDLVKDLIRQVPWLHYTVTGITTLAALLYIILLVHELRVKLDAHFDYQRRRMDRLVHRTQKSLQRTIAGTGDSSVRDYALTKLREICNPELYSDILTGIAEKERKPEVKEILLIRAKQSGGKK